MIEQFLTWVSHLTELGSGSALVVAFVWGAGSVVLSPCHLASVPLIVAYISRGSTLSVKRALGVSALFSFGIFVSIVVIGLVTAMFGRMAGDIGPWGGWLVAAVFMVFGLVLLGVITLPWSGPNMAASRQSGWLGALVLGLIFGAAVGPCTFAYMAPILAVVFDKAAAGFLYSTLLILLYSIGHCGVIVLAGTLGARLQTFLNWDQKTHLTVRIRKLCGAILILIGLYLLWKA
jgi:cytochrome c-type biogenesis protein